MIWFLTGCVLFNDIDIANCSSAQQCQQAFGSTFTCNTQSDVGYCEEITLPSRCTTTPEDLFTAPSNDDGSNPYDNTYIIGQLFDSENDSGKIAAADLAFEDLLATQTNDIWLDNMRLGRVMCDYSAGDDNEDGTQIVEDLTNTLVKTIGVNVIIGPSSSSKAYRAFQTANSTEPSSLFISPSATADILKTQDGTTHTHEDPGLFWRTTGPDQFQANILHWIVRERADVSDIAIVYQEGIYGEGLFSELRDIFTDSDITVHSRILDGDSDSVTPKINSVMGDAEEISALIFISSQQTDIVEAVDTMGDHLDTDLLLTDSAAKEEVLQGIATFIAGNTALQERIIQQVSGTKPTIPNTSLFSNFTNRLPAAEQNVFSAHTYDAVWLGALSITWAHYQQDPYNLKELGRGLRNTASDDLVNELELTQSNWPQIRNELQRGNPINITGVSGNLDFDLETEELKTGIDVWTFSAGLTSFNVEITCYANDCVTE